MNLQDERKMYDNLLRGVEIPKFVRVKFNLPVGDITAETIPAVVRETVTERNVFAKVKAGESVALTCGSREISNIHIILKSIVDILKEIGAKPFIIPAMGSHGGATAEGQKAFLTHYGVTEEFIGAPVRATMETSYVGESASGVPVYMDKYAWEADWLIPVGRVKPHTDFRGKIESGVMKMLTIGCGKQYGANFCHEAGMPNMYKNVTEMARVMINSGKVLCGVAILEDAFHGTYKIKALPADVIEQEEEQLLAEAKDIVPGIPFEKADVLILDEIGKNISGTGYDPNIVGRSMDLGRWKPNFENIMMRGISKKSHHSGFGLGLGDVVTQRFVDEYDPHVTVPNAITAHKLPMLRMPYVMPDDYNALRIAMHTCIECDKEKGIRIVWMHNSLCIDSFLISEALIPEAEAHPLLEIVSEPMEVEYDEDYYFTAPESYLGYCD